MTKAHGRAPSQRQLRVGEEIRHIIAGLIERGAMADPRLRDIPVTVTEVRVTPDLRQAQVFVVPLGGGEAEPIVAALTRAAPFFRAQVAHAMRLKFAPDLRFAADTSFEQARRIDEVLRRPSVARDLRGEEHAGKAEEEESEGGGEKENE